MKQFLETGKIVAVHGIRGEIRVQPWCDSDDMFCRFKKLYYDENGERIVPKISAKPHKNVIIMKLDGVDTVEKAQALRNKVLYVNRDEIKLPKGSHFIQDLIGLLVLDADSGEEYGTLCDVFQTGANDVYTIKQKSGKELLIPVIDDVIIETNIEQGFMKIRPLDGLFED